MSRGMAIEGPAHGKVFECDAKYIYVPVPKGHFADVAIYEWEPFSGMWLYRNVTELEKIMRYKRNELQHHDECRQFCNILATGDVRSYLEIGSGYGGSIWAVGCSLRPGAKLVSVEVNPLPDLDECLLELTRLGHSTLLIKGSSGADWTVEEARKHGPYDAILIDGGHTYEVVRGDWEKYGPMAKMVALHDISASRPRPDKPWKGDVRRLWNEIKEGQRYVQIEEPGGIGFGVLWRQP